MSDDQFVVPLASRFAVVVRQMRHARGMTQRDFAALVGTGAAELSKWENGLRNPTLASVSQLIRLTNASDEEVSALLSATILGGWGVRVERRGGSLIVRRIYVSEGR